MNEFDAVTLLLIVVASILGWRSGAIPQVAGLLGAFAGGAAALYVLPHLGDVMSGMDPFVRPFIVLVALVGAVVFGESVGAGFGRAIARRLGTGLFGTLDRAAGSGFGVLQALLIVWLAGTLLADGPVPRLAEKAGGSTAVRTMAAILPPPTELAVGLGSWLNTSGLPDVFIGFEPLPAAPVDRPDDPAARAIAAAAEASTLKVSAATCGVSTVGTGFAVAEGYVVTNAHVIAGADARGVRVSAVGGRLLDAAPVLFDPDLDVALLHVPGLHAVALRMASKDPGRGTLGASLGYPGGGRLTIVPVAVTGRYPAIGHDIYGRDQVDRQILELRAAIDRGDSGGPLVLADGTVGGVVFAEARTSLDVGYALAATEVSRAIGPALGRTAAVSTGACLD